MGLITERRDGDIHRVAGQRQSAFTAVRIAKDECVRFDGRKEIGRPVRDGHRIQSLDDVADLEPGEAVRGEYLLRR